MCNSIWLRLRSSAMRRKLNLLKRAKFSRALIKKLDTTLLKLHHIEALLSSLSFLPQIWRKLHEVEDLNFSIKEKKQLDVLPHV